MSRGGPGTTRSGSVHFWLFADATAGYHIGAIPFDRVREWLYEHGYRDHYPRRDAIDPSTYFYTFVKDGRRPVLFPVNDRGVDPIDFGTIKREVLSDEQRDGK